MPTKKRRSRSAMHSEGIDFEKISFSYLKEDFYTFPRKALLENKSLVERLSSGKINYSKISTNEELLKKAHKLILTINLTLFKFITKEKIPNINLNYDSLGSFCNLNMNYIEIGLASLANETFQSFPPQLLVDNAIAVSFHEQYHKRYTVKDLANLFNISVDEYYYDKGATGDKIKKYLSTSLHGTIFNILEDHRIERLGNEELPGFGFYFDEGHKFAYAIHFNEIFNSTLTSDKLETVPINYLLYKVLLPDLFEAYKDKIFKCLSLLPPTPENDALKVLLTRIDDYFVAYHGKIYSKHIKEILECTGEIYCLFPKLLREKLEEKVSNSGVITLLENPDLSSGKSTRMTPELLSDLEKINEECYTEFLKSQRGSSKSNEEDEDNEDELKDKCKTEKINYDITGDNNSYEEFQIIDEPLNPVDTNLLSAAEKLSQLIKRNIAFLDSRYSKVHIDYELTEGDIDDDELFSLKFNKNIFFNENEKPTYSLDFGILLDESGSMSSLIEEAKKAVLSLMLALHKAKHINLFVYGHTQKIAKKVSLYRYYNTLQKKKNINTIFSAHSRSGNADGYAILKMGEIMLESKSKHKILIVASDGQPSASHYSGEAAIKHTKSAVEYLESKGIYVIQICMDYIENSNLMFNHFVQYEENASFIKNLNSILLKKLIEFSKLA